MKTYNNTPIIEDLSELNINPMNIQPSMNILKYGDDLYQLFLPVTQSVYSGFLIKIPEIPEDKVVDTNDNGKGESSE